MNMDERVFPDLDTLSRSALEGLLRVMRVAVAQRGRFSVALSGGHTPTKLYMLWAHAGKYGVQIPWERVHLSWSDERFVPHDDPLSNYRMTRENLVVHVPIPAENVHPMPGSISRPEEAAAAYESELREFFGPAQPGFDLQLLGLGVEGHTASLFPGSPALKEKQRWVVAVQAPTKPPIRLTLTPIFLNRGRNTFFLVAGKDKQEIVRALRNEPESIPSRYPAGQIRPAGRVIWFVDKAAAG